MEVKIENCVICGHPFHEDIEPDDDCLCCGVKINYWAECKYNECWQFSLENSKDNLLYIHNTQNNWLAEKKAQWDVQQMQPEGWNEEMALAQIKANVPTEFQ